MINLKVIAESGQSFRFRKIAESDYTDVYSVCRLDRSAFVRQNKDTMNIDFVGTTSIEVETIWKAYLDLDADYSPIISKIEESNDEFLKSAAEYCKGMTILRQDFWEAFISCFIGKSTTINKLCVRFGGVNRSFPTKEMLDNQVQRIEDLDGLGLGYRQKYLYEIIKRDSSDIVPDYDKLIQLKGVGPKVSSKALMYGAHDLTQFPMDSYTEKIIHKVYDDKFDTTPYAGFEGFVWQIMNCYHRHLEVK